MPSKFSDLFLNRRLSIILLASAHALLLCWATFFWMSLKLEFGDELLVARLNQMVKYLLLNKPDSITQQTKQELLFVNCSYDKMLIPYADDFGAGNKAVCDREKLREFFNIINQAPQKPKMIVVDIYFDHPSEYDSSLYTELLKLPKAIFSTFVEGEAINKPFANLNYAIAEYESTTGEFLKYDLLFADTLHTVPTAMYAMQSGDNFYTSWGRVRSKKGTWMNSFIVDMAFRKIQFEVEGPDHIINWNLSEALRYFSEEEIHEYIQDKIIIIGDIYDYDMHDTLLGEQPGPIILANTYLAIMRGVPLHHFFHTFLLFSIYFLASIYILKRKSHRKNIFSRRILRSRAGRTFLRYFSYILIFSLMAVLLYVITLKHFQLFVFALYFSFLDYAVRRNRHKNFLRKLTGN